MCRLRNFSNLITFTLVSTQLLTSAASLAQQKKTSPFYLGQHESIILTKSDGFEKQKNFSPPDDPPPKTTQGSGTH